MGDKTARNAIFPKGQEVWKGSVVFRMLCLRSTGALWEIYLSEADITYARCPNNCERVQQICRINMDKGRQTNKGSLMVSIAEKVRKIRCFHHWKLMREKREIILGIVNRFAWHTWHHLLWWMDWFGQELEHLIEKLSSSMSCIFSNMFFATVRSRNLHKQKREESESYRYSF